MARYNFTTNLSSYGYKVYIYTKYSNQSAKIYTSSTSTSAIESVPQITTNSTGLVSFWVDTDDYSYNQRFTLEITDLYNKHYSNIDDINIFDIAYYDSNNPLPIINGGTGNNAGTITTASQPNITEVGTLTSVTTSGNMITTEQLYANGGISVNTKMIGSHEATFGKNKTWTVPPNIANIVVSCCAGGGGGGAGVSGDSGGGGGSAGQAFTHNAISVTAGNLLSITIGAGGAGGSGGAGADGGATIIIDTTTSTTILGRLGGVGGSYGDVTTVVNGGGGHTGVAPGGAGYLISTPTTLSVGGSGSNSGFGSGGLGGVGSQVGGRAGEFGSGGGGGAGADGGAGSIGRMFFYW